MFAEEQVVAGHGALEICFADVVDVHTAAFHILPRLALALAQAGVDEEFDEREARAVELGLLDLFRGHFADDLVEGAFADAREVAAEEDFAGALIKNTQEKRASPHSVQNCANPEKSVCCRRSAVCARVCCGPIHQIST